MSGVPEAVAVRNRRDRLPMKYAPQPMTAQKMVETIVAWRMLCSSRMA